MNSPNKGILKLAGHDERAELEHHLRWFANLSLPERFRIVEQQSSALLWMLIRGGYRKPFEILKRPLR
jgi:hypothetical protein